MILIPFLRMNPHLARCVQLLTYQPGGLRPPGPPGLPADPSNPLACLRLPCILMNEGVPQADGGSEVSPAMSCPQSLPSHPFPQQEQLLSASGSAALTDAAKARPWLFCEPWSYELLKKFTKPKVQRS